MIASKKDPKTGEFLGTGRRKTSVASVRIKSGSGNVTVNGRTFEDYFPVMTQRTYITDTLEAVGLGGKIDMSVTVSGGGPAGQSGACRMALARALCGMDAENFPKLRHDGFLTRDSRMKERKKYGLRGARRGTQFAKR
ncbi:MAG: 30S ribosomal protein S9 [Planctomycetota bacterium]